MVGDLEGHPSRSLGESHRIGGVGEDPDHFGRLGTGIGTGFFSELSGRKLSNIITMIFSPG